MKTTLLFLLILTFGLTGCSNQEKAKAVAKQPGNTPELRRQWLKDYAFCSCVELISDSETLKNNDISIGIYRDISGYDQQAYNSVDSLAKLAVSQIKPSVIADYDGKKPLLMGCIEFHQSKALDSVVNTYKSTGME